MTSVLDCKVWMQELMGNFNAIHFATLLLLIPLATYLISLLSFSIKLRRNAGHPPSVPYLFPFIAHTSTFAAGDTKLASALINQSVREAPVRFKGLGFNFVLLSGAELIRKALTTSNQFDWNKINAPLFGQMFGAPKKICEATLHDDSGIGAKPYSESNVHPGRRLLRNQVIFFADAFSKSSLDELVPRFVSNVRSRCTEADGIGSEWVEMPDLYVFVRDILFPAATESFFGKTMLNLNPSLSEDFWNYDDNINFLATGMPTWLRPRAIRHRNQCLESVKRWRRNAEKQSTKDPRDENATWNMVWGLGAIQRRNKLLEGTEGLYDDDAKAATDLATLWAFTSNVIPASFWYLYEILSSEGLLERAREELQHPRDDVMVASSRPFDANQSTNNPLLQSIFAETLRLHVASLITRTVKKTHRLGDWLLEKDQYVIVSSHVEHMDAQWDFNAEEKESHPFSEFWADRFLVHDDNGNVKFSLDGSQGRWIPFGLGEHMCPGRHFAKQEMILNFAVLVSEFDFELLSAPGWRPDNNFERYGFGAQQPRQKVPIRIRRRETKQKGSGL